MAGFGKLVMAALAVSLVPYELKKGEDGSFSYKSLLLNVDSGKDEAGEKKVTVSFFNKPDFMKKPAAEDAEAPTEEAPVEEARTLTPEEEEDRRFHEKLTSDFRIPDFLKNDGFKRF